MIVAHILTPLEDLLRNVLEWLGPHGAIGLPWSWSIVAPISVRMSKGVFSSPGTTSEGLASGSGSPGATVGGSSRKLVGV